MAHYTAIKTALRAVPSLGTLSLQLVHFTRQSCIVHTISLFMQVWMPSQWTAMTRVPFFSFIVGEMSVALYGIRALCVV